MLSSNRVAVSAKRLKAQRPKARPLSSGASALLVIVSVTTLLVALFVRIRLLEIPLERDEGEYAYAGQLLLQGIAPYSLVYNMKFPGTYLAYAAVMAIFGETIRGVHLGLLVVNAATAVLLFLLGKRLFDSRGGIVAATCYVVLSFSPAVLGFAAHATHFVVLPACGAFLLLSAHPHRLRHLSLVCAGFLLGLAVLMKQPAAIFVVFAAGYVFIRDRALLSGWRAILQHQAALAAGVAVPLGGTLGWLWNVGVFETFWFWTFDYAREYGRLLPLSSGWQYLRRNGADILNADGPLWAIAAIGFALMTIRSRNWRLVFLSLLLICSAVAVSAGFYFRHHYFILLLPVVSLFVAAAIVIAHDWGMARSRWLAVLATLCLASSFAWSLVRNRDFYFKMTPAEASRHVYWPNPFVESLRIADFLRENTDATDRIAVLGSEPQIYFYSRRRSATGYIYMYPLLEKQPYAATMQREMISEIERVRPKFLVFASIPYSWQVGPGSERAVLEWINSYCAQYYRGLGVISIFPEATEYHLPLESSLAPRAAGNFVLVYQRND